MQVTHEVISDLEASKYQMVEWRSVQAVHHVHARFPVDQSACTLA